MHFTHHRGGALLQPQLVRSSRVLGSIGDQFGNRENYVVDDFARPHPSTKSLA